ncbi:MAG TPA: hypothetical protein VFI95_05150 [Terriglobales bacterium]|nr:hypothetical protein [Terriglobales bacterium]
MNLPLPQPAKKSSLLPVLVVLFLISYGLMVMLVVEQNTTMMSQRYLIQQLMSDSMELNSLKTKAVFQHRAEAQAQSKNQSQTPSSQAAPEAKKNAQQPGLQRNGRNMPERPPKATSDTLDARRAVILV